jgi:hypothetical protein
MKNLVFATMITLFIGTSAFAAPNDAPYKSINALKKAYQQSNQITWSKYASYQKASLVEAGMTTEMFYTLEGDFIGSSKTFAYDKLPKNALNQMAVKYAYPEFELVKCIEFVNADNETNYYLSLSGINEDLYLQVNEKGQITEMNN